MQLQSVELIMGKLTNVQPAVSIASKNSKGEKAKLIEEKRVEIAAAVSRASNGEIN